MTRCQHKIKIELQNLKYSKMENTKNEQQCAIHDVSKSVCKHEWIMTADSFDQTCYCKKCGKSS